MVNEISVKKLIRSVRDSRFLVDCEMPMGYAEGFPILRQRNGELLVMIPFLRFQVTGKVDRTLVYPIRFVITVRARDGKIVGYQDLTADGRFGKVDFDQPIGLFRHEAIRSWDKQTYRDNKQLLYRLYDRVCGAMAQGRPVTREEQEPLRSLLMQMVEPCQLPIYRALDGSFYDTYLA